MSQDESASHRERVVQYLITTGNAYLQASKHSVAKPFFQRVVVMSPRLAMGHHGLGLCLQGAGRFELAARCHYLAGMLDVDDPGIPFAAAQCYWQLGHQRLAQRAAHEAKRRLSSAYPESLATRVLRFCDQMDHINDGYLSKD